MSKLLFQMSRASFNMLWNATTSLVPMLVMLDAQVCLSSDLIELNYIGRFTWTINIDILKMDSFDERIRTWKFSSKIGWKEGVCIPDYIFAIAQLVNVTVTHKLTSHIESKLKISLPVF